MTTTVRFDGRRVLVTGAGKGIGRGIAKKLAECGAEVLSLSRTQADLDSLQAEVPNIVPVCVDLEDWDATRKAVDDLGPVHLLVNNAAITMHAPFIEMSKESLERSFATNVYATVNVSQVVAKGMIERGEGGSIVIMSSICSGLALPDTAAYSGTKGALDSIMHMMAKELGPHQIRVNCVYPTAVMTPMGRRYWEDSPLTPPFLGRHPLGKFPEVEDIVDGTLFLLSNQSSMITGTCLPIDCGLTAN